MAHRKTNFTEMISNDRLKVWHLALNEQRRTIEMSRKQRIHIYQLNFCEIGAAMQPCWHHAEWHTLRKANGTKIAMCNFLQRQFVLSIFKQNGRKYIFFILVFALV